MRRLLALLALAAVLAVPAPASATGAFFCHDSVFGENCYGYGFNGPIGTITCLFQGVPVPFLGTALVIACV